MCCFDQDYLRQILCHQFYVFKNAFVYYVCNIKNDTENLQLEWWVLYEAFILMMKYD